MVAGCIPRTKVSKPTARPPPGCELTCREPAHDVVGVAAQYASALGKTANWQTLVSLTLARGEVPVIVALRLFLPESWTSDRVRLKRAGVPVEYRMERTKPDVALAEIDRVIAAGVRARSVSATRWRRLLTTSPIPF